MSERDALTKMFATHRQLFSDSQSHESLVASFGYWQGWPEILGTIRAAVELNEENDNAVAYNLRRDLAFTHQEAENRLTVEAVRLNLDPGAFCEAGRYCRELICSDCRSVGVDAAGYTWPDFLGQRRYELPPILQQAIVDGEALLRTLNAKLVEKGEAPLETGPQGEKEHKGQSHEEFTLEEKALALLVSHPEWTDTKIAKEVGCNRTTLYKWERFKQARAAVKSGRDERPRGHKNLGSGDVDGSTYDPEWDDDN